MISAGGLRFASPMTVEPETKREAKAKAPRRVKATNDPKLVAAAAREVRDRWLERVNDDPSALLAQGKYDVSRALPEQASGTTIEIVPIPLLPAP